jgi:tetratricopeptide (TPR) repeat protein
MQERYAQAEELINQAIAIQEKTYGSNHHLISVSWLTKAKICQEQGNFVQAEQLINKSLAALEKSGNAALLEKFQKAVKDIRVRQVAYKPQG